MVDITGSDSEVDEPTEKKEDETMAEPPFPDMYDEPAPPTHNTDVMIKMERDCEEFDNLPEAQTPREVSITGDQCEMVDNDVGGSQDAIIESNGLSPAVVRPIVDAIATATADFIPLLFDMFQRDPAMRNDFVSLGTNFLT
ncbi:hypothetical protein BJ508DRAFT_329445 [Ascobolus immersus RN42]|uniref:Uncharacterized protein n=1 Tax=Ascobolus immersus RN42 TaxID=1160509 RepID=A0A3N4HYR1_ASCIM|nr:hypothetical protein BJ508DRAFT_329445 [Ascobolus immersus RN42]